MATERSAPECDARDLPASAGLGKSATVSEPKVSHSRRSLIRRLALAAGAIVLGALGGAWWLFGDHTVWRQLVESPYSGRCNKELSRAPVERALALGTRFMLAHQKPAGNFDYEYDWKTKTYTDDDNEVRQAGAFWGLALLYRDRPTPELAAAIEKGLAFVEQHSVRTEAGVRCVAYPGKGESGHRHGGARGVDAHRVPRRSARAAPERRAFHAERLTEYVSMLAASVNADGGLWFGSYDAKTCVASGAPSPYSDGEALLALVKVAKYTGLHEQIPLALRTADAGQRLNVVQALAADSDSDTTKGYYQWGSMAFYELATSGWPGTERYGDQLLALSDWQIDVHRTLTRQRNTGYAYEGLIPAYDWARRKGDTVRTAKIACIIDLGLGRLLTWPVGGPLASSTTRDVASDDRLAVGGIQNEASTPRAAHRRDAAPDARAHLREGISSTRSERRAVTSWKRRRTSWKRRRTSWKRRRTSP